MVSIKELPNFIEDFEYESRKIEYKIDPNRPGLSGGEEDEHESIPLVDETIRISRREAHITNKSI